MTILLNINQSFEGYIAFSKRLFKHIDDELAPITGILTLNHHERWLHVTFGDENYDYELSKMPTKALLDQGDLLDTFIKLFPFYDHHWHETSASAFHQVENTLFGFILIFDKRKLTPYERLPLTDRMPYRSMIDAIVEMFLKQVDLGIDAFLKGDILPSLSVNSVIKSAAKHIFNALIDKSDLTNPYDHMSKISSKRYENAFSSGSILFLTNASISPDGILPLSLDKALPVDESISVIEPLILLQHKIPLNQLRHVRKILEISQDDIMLLSDGEAILGSVKSPNAHDVRKYFDHMITVDFSAVSSWQLSYNDAKIFQVIHGEVTISKPKVSYYKFSSSLKALYPTLNSQQTITLYKLILEATKQKKGTIIVISKNARSEAFRLENQGFIIASKKLTPEMMLSITAIDGAVLMDLDGVCQGIGFILDGMATDKGDASRGARYNSTIRYVETIAKHDTFADIFAVVVSEDGDADIITKHTLQQM